MPLAQQPEGKNNQITINIMQNLNIENRRGGRRKRIKITTSRGGIRL